MRQVLQLVFLLFYVASAYAITQERVSLIVQEIQHSTSRDEQQQFDDSCKQLRNGYPHYREAKTVNTDKYVRPATVVHSAPAIRIRFFVPHITSFQIDVSLETSCPRAPPVF